MLLAACVLSRLATAIYYIEDPDSLRFALSVADRYDVAALQPHFPGYPVFWFVAKVFYLLTGRFAIAFALIGGLSTFVLCRYVLRLLQANPLSQEGFMATTLVFFNPLLWLMGTRYMPDLMGLAVALAAFYHTSAALTGRAALWSSKQRWGRVLFGHSVRQAHACLGLLLTGLLAGVRLSYVPFVLLPTLWVLVQDRHGLARRLAFGAVGVLAWLIPLILATGWSVLLAAAHEQTAGHFTEFGGTIQTNAHLSVRLWGLLEGLWADGLGAYWSGRHPLTWIVSVGVLLTLGLGGYRLATSQRDRQRWLLLGTCWLAYAGWIFLYQNVIYKSRHVLPLLPPLLMVMALGAALLWRRQGGGRLTVLLLFAAYTTITLVMVYQHRQPSAIAQAKDYVAAYAQRHPADSLVVVTIPLVHDYLAAQGVAARFLSVEDKAALACLRHAPRRSPTVVIGTYPGLLCTTPDTTLTFYHNPYVNRMWPEVPVAVYDARP